jgi:hypothetical protein
VGEATTRRNEVRAERWFFICGQQPVATADVAELPMTVLRSPDILRPSGLLLVRSAHCVSSRKRHC